MKLTKEGIAVIEGDNYLSADIIAQGRLNVAREFLLQYKPYIPEGGVVVDVGACLGDFTATFSEFVGPGGRVYAYEPNPTVFGCLLHNMKPYPNVVISDIALGECRRWSSIAEDEHNIGASYLTGIGQDTIYPSGNIISILVMPLDVLGAFHRIDFIKIDAEGYEPLVLDGAQETLKRLSPTMLIEIDQRALGFQGFTPKDVHARLDALGYDFPRFDGAHGDILCLPKEQK